MAMTWWRGDVVAAGAFLRAGEEYSTQLARFDGNEWHMLGAANGTIFDALEFQGDLVVTGQFSAISGVACNRVARFDGTAWHAMGQGAGETALAVFQNQLHAGGAGAPHRWNGTSWQQVTSAVGGQVMAMVEFQGRLYVGGSIGQFGGPGPYLVAFDGQQTTTVGMPPNAPVSSLFVHQGELWVGGQFTSIGGIAAAHVAIWNGTSFRAAGTGLPGPGGSSGVAVSAFAALGNDVFAGGTFHSGTLPAAPANRIARWNGSVWTPLGSGTNGGVGALLADPAQNRLFVGGRFFLAGGKPANEFAEWNETPRWTDLGFGTAGATPFQLLATGLPRASATTRFEITRAPVGAAAALVLGFDQAFLPVLGVTVLPQPELLVFLQCDALGAASFTLVAPPGLPPGPELFAQALAIDSTAPLGLAATRAAVAQIR